MKVADLAKERVVGVRCAAAWEMGVGGRLFYLLLFLFSIPFLF